MKAIILGIVQGITEFLPISSSGHLVLLQSLMNVESPGVILEVTLHFGTLLSIIIFFRKRIVNYLTIKKLTLIIVGTIPIGIIGFLLKKQIESLFSEPLVVCVMLSITGVVLFLTRTRLKVKRELNLKTVFIIGVAQAIALIPGISRSGLTVSTALLIGISREQSFEFSFMLAIPALLGAFILEFPDITKSSVNYFQIISGAITALLFGLFALWVFYKSIKKQRLHYFSYYLWFVSVSGLLLFLTSRSLL
mgnify:CR=1 FL=1